MDHKLSALNRKKINKITHILESVFHPMKTHGQCLVGIDKGTDKIKSYVIQIETEGNHIPILSAYTFDEMFLKASLLQKGLEDFEHDASIFLLDGLIEHLHQATKEKPDLALLTQEIERNSYHIENQVEQKFEQQYIQSHLKH
jgi:serine phosphatase RsbU (regulator of sigma subunit)